jgi:hypothetical protein
MPHRPWTLLLALLTPLLLLLALGATTSTAPTDEAPDTELANLLTRQRAVVVASGAALPALTDARLDGDDDNAVTAADIMAVAQTWSWQR